MSELIRTHQSEPAAAQSTTSWEGEGEDRGPEKPRSAGATATMVPSNTQTHTHVFTQADACWVTTVTHTHTLLIKKHVVNFCGFTMQVSVSLFTPFVFFGSVSEEEDWLWPPWHTLYQKRDDQPRVQWPTQQRAEHSFLAVSHQKPMAAANVIHQKQPSYKTVLPFLTGNLFQKFFWSPRSQNL